MPLYHKQKTQPLSPARYPPHKWWEAQAPDSPSPVSFSGRGATPFSTTSILSRSGSSTSHRSKLRTLLSSLGHFPFSLRRCRCCFHSSRDAEYDDATISSVSTGTQCPSDDEDKREQDNDRVLLRHRSRTRPFAEDHSDTYDDIKQWLTQRKRQYQHQHQRHRHHAASTSATNINNAATTTTTTNNNTAKNDSQVGGGGGGDDRGQSRRRFYKIQWRDDPEPPAAFSSSSSPSASPSVYAQAYQRYPARSRQTRTRMSPGVGTLVPTENEYSQAMAAMMSRNVRDVLKRLEVDRMNAVCNSVAAAGSFPQREEVEEDEVESFGAVADFERGGEEEAEDSASTPSGSSATSYGSVHTVSSIAFSGFPSLITIENQHQQKEEQQTITRSASQSSNYDDDDDARELPGEVVSRNGTPSSPPVIVHAPPFLSLQKTPIMHLDHQTTFPPFHTDYLQLDQTTNTSTTNTPKTTAKTIRAFLYFTLELPHSGGFVRSHPIHAQPLILELSTHEYQCRAVQQLQAYLRRISASSLFSVTENPFLDDRNDDSASCDGAAAAAVTTTAVDQNQAEKTANNDSNSTSQNLAINFPQLFSPHHPCRQIVEKVWGRSLHWAWADASEIGFSEALVVLLGRIGEEQMQMQKKMMMTHEDGGGGGHGRGYCRTGLKGSMDSALSGLESLVEGESDGKGEERWRTVTLDVVCVLRRLDRSGEDGDGYGYGMPMDVRTTTSGLLNLDGRESDQYDVFIK